MTKTLEVVAKKKRLGDVKAVSELIDVSREHVRRLDDRGAMPKAIRLGRSIPLGHGRDANGSRTVARSRSKGAGDDEKYSDCLRAMCNAEKRSFGGMTG